VKELPSHSHLAQDTWRDLRRYTQARIALGRSGASLPTGEVLDLSMAHARARDAVHLPLDTQALAASLIAEGFRVLHVRSSAVSRREYLRRPDLGRKLHPEDEHLLAVDDMPEASVRSRLTIVIADGLSSLAPARHALPLLLQLRQQFTIASSTIPNEAPGAPKAWLLDTIVIATQARVALADRVGILRRAEAVAILLGERPGLSSPDSLGIYMTYAPRAGVSDADRNCISNVRPQGTSYAEAAYKLHYLLERSRLFGKSGVAIKDNSEWVPSGRLLF
jgi:ethanolamine ammonia-lyase small subunit